jgi:hypothetical protein
LICWSRKTTFYLTEIPFSGRKRKNSRFLELCKKCFFSKICLIVCLELFLCSLEYFFQIPHENLSLKELLNRSQTTKSIRSGPLNRASEICINKFCKPIYSGGHKCRPALYFESSIWTKQRWFNLIIYSCSGDRALSIYTCSIRKLSEFKMK